MYRNKNRNRNQFRSMRDKEEEEPDTSEAVGFANVEASNTQMYLVKLPEFLFHQFSRPVVAGQPPPVLGRLRLFPQDKQEKNGAGPTRVGKIFVDGEQGVSAFNLVLNSKPAMYVLSEEHLNDDPKLRVEGRATAQCSAQPILDEQYRELQRERTRIAETKTRTTQFMDDQARRAAENSALRPNAHVESTRQREERKRVKEMSRRHLDLPDEEYKKMVKMSIYNAFEIELHWSADKLAKQVEEPIGRVRPIINELCTYMKSGPFAGMYELKDEFKTPEQKRQKERQYEEHKQRMIENAKKRREEREEQERANKRARRT